MTGSEVRLRLRVSGYYGYSPNPAGYLLRKSRTLRKGTPPHVYDHSYAIRKRYCLLENARGVGAAGPPHSRRLGGVLFTANVSKDWLAITR